MTHHGTPSPQALIFDISMDKIRKINNLKRKAHNFKYYDLVPCIRWHSLVHMSLTLYLYPGYPKYLLTYLFLEKCTFVWITYVKKWLCICCNFFLFLPINNFVVTETIKVTDQLQFICTFIAENTHHGMLVTIPQCNFDLGIPKILKVFYASVDRICLGIPKNA